MAQQHSRQCALPGCNQWHTNLRSYCSDFHEEQHKKLQHIPICSTCSLHPCFQNKSNLVFSRVCSICFDARTKPSHLAHLAHQAHQVVPRQVHFVYQCPQCLVNFHRKQNDICCSPRYCQLIGRNPQPRCADNGCFYLAAVVPLTVVTVMLMVLLNFDLTNIVLLFLSDSLVIYCRCCYFIIKKIENRTDRQVH